MPAYHLSFYGYPTLLEGHPKPGVLYTLPDLQGNFLFLLCFLTQHRLIRISRFAYLSLSIFYRRMEKYTMHSKADHDGSQCPFSHGDMVELNQFIQTITVTTLNCSIQLIGDIIGERGGCDEFTALLLLRLWHQGLDLFALLSNHDLCILTEWLTMTQDQWAATLDYPSSRHAVRLQQKGIPTTFGCDFLRNDFLPRIKVLHVVIDQANHIIMYHHAPGGLELAVHLADRLGVTLRLNTPDDLIQTVNAINAAYLQQANRNLSQGVGPRSFLLGDPTQKHPPVDDYYLPPGQLNGMIDPTYDPILAITNSRSTNQDGSPANVYNRDENGDDQPTRKTSQDICCTSLAELRERFPTLDISPDAHYKVTVCNGHEGFIMTPERREDLAELDPLEQAKRAMESHPYYSPLKNHENLDGYAEWIRASRGYVAVTDTIKRQCQPTIAASNGFAIVHAAMIKVANDEWSNAIVHAHFAYHWRITYELLYLFDRALKQRRASSLAFDIDGNTQDAQTLELSHTLFATLAADAETKPHPVKIRDCGNVVGYASCQDIRTVLQTSSIHTVKDEVSSSPKLKRRKVNRLIASRSRLMKEPRREGAAPLDPSQASIEAKKQFIQDNKVTTALILATLQIDPSSKLRQVIILLQGLGPEVIFRTLFENKPHLPAQSAGP